MPERTPFFQSSVFKILVYLLGIMLLASLLAPWLYSGGKHVVAEGWLKGTWLGGLHGSMERAKFSRFFNRSVLLSALVLLWPALKWLNAGKARGETSPAGSRNGTLLRAFQLSPNPWWWGHLLGGFVLAAGTLLLLGGFYVSEGWYQWRDAGKSLASILLGALGTGLAVGLLEEFVFRGALQVVVSKLLRPRTLFVVIAAFFAVVHFFNPPQGLEAKEVTATTGLWMVGQIFGHFFSQFASPGFLLAEFAVLFAIGLVLGYTRMKTGSLWLGTGLHAGWVFGVKTFSPLTERAFAPAEMMPWLGDTLRVGAVSCLVVLFTGLILWLWLRKRYGDPFAETP
ncbi:MAG: CPBP family intramembrane metalloprotease [Verrucomicrobiae bacterium]|nr:CPBP family intramembrane metalloprotease [Verrucomicrobiae bacterium]